jgi:DNA-binding MarR family transcriptional regulator/N-acetylglutamate synthase-like GNAT family acetyltransferase
MMDTLVKFRYLTDASRFRGISEKLYAEGDQVYKDAGIDFKASWFPVYAILAGSRSPLTVMDIARQIAFSHITVKNILRELETDGLVVIKPNPGDRRSKIIKLSVDGRKLLSRLKPIWRDFSAALQSIFVSGHPDFLNILDRIEQEMISFPINKRLKEPHEYVRIVDYKPSMKGYFNKLAGTWLRSIRDGELKEEDIFTLNNPDQAYLLNGGFVFFAVFGGEVVGTVALRRLDEDSFEFDMLYVDAEYRKLGIAKKLIERCISRCKENRAEELWLQSTGRMREAHQLFKKLGFEEKEAPLQMTVSKRTDEIMCISL